MQTKNLNALLAHVLHISTLASAPLLNLFSTPVSLYMDESMGCHPSLGQGSGTFNPGADSQDQALP